MSDLYLNWVTVLDAMTENFQPRFRILDTIVFDNLNTLRPLFWVFTLPTGCVQKNNLREWTAPEIVDNILHVCNKNPNTLVFKISQTGERDLILSPKHENLVVHSLKAIQIYKGSVKIKPELIVHNIPEIGEESLYLYGNSGNTLIEMTNPISFRAKAMSGLIIYTIRKSTNFTIKSAKFFYYASSQFNDLWLAWVSNILQEKPEPSSKPATRNLSRSYSRLPHHELKHEWRTFSKGIPIIRGRHIKVPNKSSKMNKSVGKVEVELKNSLHPGLDESLKLLPIVQDYYGVQCRGQFCKMESIRMTKYDLSLRCLIPMYLIEMGQKSGNSPYINSSLRKIPKAFDKDLEFKRFNKKIHFSKKVPVCLKCYIVYYNIKRNKS